MKKEKIKEMGMDIDEILKNYDPMEDVLGEVPDLRGNGLITVVSNPTLPFNIYINDRTGKMGRSVSEVSSYTEDIINEIVEKSALNQENTNSINSSKKR